MALSDISYFIIIDIDNIEAIEEQIDHKDPKEAPITNEPTPHAFSKSHFDSPTKWVYVIFIVYFLLIIDKVHVLLLLYLGNWKTRISVQKYTFPSCWF